jgi:dephospho-CoA kinase
MYFIILVGMPMPGSGKSYLHQKIKDFFNIKPVDIVVDNIVQSDKTYISTVKKY